MAQNYSSAIRTINRLFKAGSGIPQAKTILVSGKPGIGKTAMAYHFQSQYTKATGKNWEVIKVKLADYFPEDFSGIPQVDVENMVTRWFSPDWLPIKGSKAFIGRYIILLLDEVNRCSPQVMQAVMKVLDRDGFIDDCLLICTGNLGFDDGTNVESFDSAQERRFFPIDLDVSIDDWTLWAKEVGISDTIVSFLNQNPKYLHLEYKNKSGDKAFVTPAHWEELDKMFKLSPEDPLLAVLDDVGYQQLQGGVYSAFREYVTSAVSLGLKDVWKLPDSPETAEKFRKLERSALTRVSNQVIDHFTPKGDEKPKASDKEVAGLAAFLTLTKEEGQDVIGENLFLSEDSFVALVKEVNDKNQVAMKKLLAHTANTPEVRRLIAYRVADAKTSNGR